MDQESVKYPKLTTYLSDGEPRIELMKEGDKVDTIRVGRYDLKALKRLMNELGLERDELMTWEKKKAEYDMERAFKESAFSKSTRLADKKDKQDLLTEEL